MVVLKTTTFGKIKRGRTFYRLASHYTNGYTYLLRRKTGPHSIEYADGVPSVCGERWNKSEKVYIRVRV